MKDEAYESLAKASPREDNTEEKIPHADEAIKQSDVLDHLKKATDNGSGK
jgi:hypothetical protein